MLQFLQVGHIFGAESAEGGIAALGVDGKALLLQIITFVIVFLLLKKFAFSKIVKTLEERQKTINQGVELGREMVEEKAKLDEKVEAMLKKARADADKIIANSHDEAAELIKQAETEASEKVAAMLSEAKARIDDDIASAKASLEKQTLELVAEVTEVVLKEKLTASKDSQLIARALKEAR